MLQLAEETTIKSLRLYTYRTKRETNREILPQMQLSSDSLSFVNNSALDCQTKWIWNYRERCARCICFISLRTILARVRHHFLWESHFFTILAQSVLVGSRIRSSTLRFFLTAHVWFSRSYITATSVSRLPNGLLGQFIIVSRLCADKSARPARPRLIQVGQINRPRTGCTDLWKRDTILVLSGRASTHPRSSTER